MQVRERPPAQGRMVGGPRGPRRIRLVAYGARLESVLSESSQGFESPILRSPDPLATCSKGGNIEA